MMKLFLLWALLLLPVGPAAAQEIKMSQTAPLEQVYGETVEDDALLPMNELDMDFGYALYETTVDVEEENPTLLKTYGIMLWSMQTANCKDI